MKKITGRTSVVILALGSIGVIIGVVAREPLVGILRKKPEPQPAQTQLPPKPEKVPPKPEEVAKRHLKSAEEQCERAVGEHVKALDSFFADSKKNTRPFAEEALSWASKWRLVVDHVPYTSGGRHEKYIRERFEEYVFKPSQLEDAIKQVVRSYLAHVRSIEGKMLVNLRADVADFPPLTLLLSLMRRSFRQRMTKHCSRQLTPRARICKQMSERNLFQSLQAKSLHKSRSGLASLLASSAPALRQVGLPLESVL